MMNRIFRIFPSTNPPSLVKEEDLERVLCGGDYGRCCGDLVIEARQETDFGRRESFLLICQKCGGQYSATSLLEGETKGIFPEGIGK